MDGAIVSTAGGEKSFAITLAAKPAAGLGRYQGEIMGKVLREVQQTTTTVASAPAPAPNKATYSEPLLNEREHTHGDFAKQTGFVQLVKSLMRDTPNWSKLSTSQRESLEMDATKTGRILFGDHNHKDSWDDKAGYAKLVAERL